MQASVISTVLLGILILPSLIMILIPLFNKVVNSSFIGYFSDSLHTLDILLGSDTINVILICIAVVMFLIIFRFFLRSISVFK